MGKRHYIYEKMRFPIEAVFAGVILLGIGNIFTNPVFGIVDIIHNDVIEAAMEVIMRTGRFIITNFPLVLMLGLISEKKNIRGPLAALLGYVSFLYATTVFTTDVTSANAFSSILGISVSSSSISWLSGNTGYPLQTGVIGPAIVYGITCFSMKRMQNRKSKENSFFFSAGTGVMMYTIVLCFAAGVLTAYIWPYFLRIISYLTAFISRDTTNPFHLAVYGISERVLTILGMGTLIRQPFWFGSNGGSWSNIAGQVITGDVSIWTAKLNQSTALYGSTGRFTTPYYLLNIFAIPGLFAGFYSMETDRAVRAKKRIYLILAMAASALCGTLLPAELTILLLSPLLYVFHLLVTGILYHILSVLGIYLGYQTASTLTQAALPGTLSEFLSYTNNSLLVPAILKLVILGVFLFFIYLFAGRLYFRHFAIGLFNPPAEQNLVRKIINSLGGIENIMDAEASASDLRIRVYDISLVNAEELKGSGSAKIYEDSENRVSLHMGGICWMIRRDILSERRNLVREEK